MPAPGSPVPLIETIRELRRSVDNVLTVLGRPASPSNDERNQMSMLRLWLSLLDRVEREAVNAHAELQAEVERLKAARAGDHECIEHWKSQCDEADGCTILERKRAESAEARLTEATNQAAAYQQVACDLHDAFVGKNNAGAIRFDLMERAMAAFDALEEGASIHPALVGLEARLTEAQAVIERLTAETIPAMFQSGMHQEKRANAAESRLEGAISLIQALDRYVVGAHPDLWTRRTAFLASAAVAPHETVTRDVLERASGSAQPCGCDPGAQHVCERHQV